jgi:hypothetical protein
MACSCLVLTKRLIFNNLFEKNLKIMLNVLVLPCIQNQRRRVGNFNAVSFGEALNLLFAVL